METLVIADYSFNSPSLTNLVFSRLSLKSVFFGKSSCKNVTTLSFIRMNDLQRIYIDSGCFTQSMKKKKNTRSWLFTCKSCAQLQEIVIESDSFCDYKECCIEGTCHWFIYLRTAQTRATDDWKSEDRQSHICQCGAVQTDEYSILCSLYHETYRR